MVIVIEGSPRAETTKIQQRDKAKDREHIDIIHTEQLSRDQKHRVIAVKTISFILEHVHTHTHTPKINVSSSIVRSIFAVRATIFDTAYIPTNCLAHRHFFKTLYLYVSSVSYYGLKLAPLFMFFAVV